MTLHYCERCENDIGAADGGEIRRETSLPSELPTILWKRVIQSVSNNNNKIPPSVLTLFHFSIPSMNGVCMLWLW